MKCTEIREMLPDLAAGLAPAEPQVNEHLRTCIGCAATLDDFRKTMALLDEWQAPEPSPYFDVRLQARLREEAAKEPARGFAWIKVLRPVMAAALEVIVIVGAAVVRLEEKKHQPTPGPVASIVPGTPVGDLQALDQNHDIYSDSDLLDDLQTQEDVNANP